MHHSLKLNAPDQAVVFNEMGECVGNTSFVILL